MKHSVTLLSNQYPEKGTKTQERKEALQAEQPTSVLVARGFPLIVDTITIISSNLEEQ